MWTVDMGDMGIVDCGKELGMGVSPQAQPDNTRPPVIDNKRENKARSLDNGKWQSFQFLLRLFNASVNSPRVGGVMK